VFAAVLEASSHGDVQSREELIASLCGGDTALIDEVRSLLLHDEAPAVDMTAAAAHVRDAVHAALENQDGLLGALPMPERIAGFRILRVLGEGGMGVVYLAEQESPRRLVALKLVRAGLAGQEILRRFRRAAEVLGSLRHPNIAQIYAAGSTTLDGHRGMVTVPYFAMEYVEGVPIGEFCRSRHLSTRERIRLFLGVCDAVEHAHGRGVIHRDLKPANILVEEVEASTRRSGPNAATDAGGSGLGDLVASTPAAALPPQGHALLAARGTPKILDFGIARRDGAEEAGAAATLRTAADQIIGTLPYMSPEQLSGDSSRIDRRSDVYALGVILHQLLADRLPLDLVDRPIAEAARMVAELEPARIGVFDPALRGDIETIVAKCLEKEPQRRYQSSAELAADLRRFLEDRPIEARPASGLYHLRKFARRNRGLVAAVALSVVTLVVATIVSIVMALRAIEARNEVQAQLIETQLQMGRSTQSYGIIRTIVDALEAPSAGKPEPTLREVLAKAHENLLKADAEDLEVLGMIQSELARANQRLGDLDAAERLYAAALAQLRAAPAGTVKDPLALAETLASAADLAAQRGRTDEANVLRLEACECFERILRHPTLEDRWRGYMHLRIGSLRWARSDLHEAAEHLRRGIEIRRALLPEGDFPLAANELLLGTVLAGLGQPLEAEEVLRRACDTLGRQLPPDDPEVLKARGNLLTAINQAGRFEEGIQLGRELQAALARAGIESGLSSAVRLNSAFGLIGSGRPSEAVPLCREVVDWRERNIGPQFADTARARVILASALRMLGDLESAEILLRNALDIHRATHGEHHVRVAEDLHELALVHLAAGRTAEAFDAAGAAAAAIIGFAGESHPIAARCWREQARALAQQGQVEEARVLAEMALERIRASTARGHPQVADALVALGSIRLKLGDAEGALASSQEASAELRRNVISPVLLAPSEALRGAALIALGRADEGATLLEEAIAILREAMGEQSPAVRECGEWKAIALAHR